MNTQTLLKKLISIPSPFPQEEAIGEYLFSFCKELGFSVKKVKTSEKRYNIVATYGKADKFLAFYGHMDTISPETTQKDAYKLIINDTKAYGLGTEDMKGGIAAILQAGAYAIKNNLAVKLIFGVDEENISQGAHDLVESGLLDDIGFLIVGESGQVQDYTQAFSIVYGRKGRILFDTVIFGKKAHAAESEKAINAIEDAAKFVTILKQSKFQKHKNLGKTRIVIHSLRSETDSFSVPNRAQIFFSLLTTPNVSNEKFIQKILIQAKEQNITVSIKPYERSTPYGESYEVDKRNIFLKKIEKQIFQKYKVSPIYASSVADENVFANKLKIPVISLGPIGGGGHTKNEWVDLTSLANVEEAYKDIIRLYNLG